MGRDKHKINQPTTIDLSDLNDPPAKKPPRRAKHVTSNRFTTSRNIASLDFASTRPTPKPAPEPRPTPERPASKRSAPDRHAPKPATTPNPVAAPPELARRRQNRKSTIKSGRTIGEQREQLEKASERQAAHKKAKRKKRNRVILVSLCFALAAVILVALYFYFFERGGEPLVPEAPAETFAPTIQIVDEDSATAGTKTELSERTKNYIGQAEADFRDLGYTPEKAVLPAGAVREIDFYLKGQPGFVKLYLDRPTAESVEDADRLIRYLKQQGITTYQYLDVRLSGKAYWK